MFLDNLKFLMGLKSHSSNDLADLLGVTYTTVFRYLKDGSKIPNKQKRAIAKIYGVPVEVMNTSDLSQKTYYEIEEDVNSIQLNDLLAMYESLKKENELLRERNELLEKIFNETLKK